MTTGEMICLIFQVDEKQPVPQAEGNVKQHSSLFTVLWSKGKYQDSLAAQRAQLQHGNLSCPHWPAAADLLLGLGS